MTHLYTHRETALMVDEATASPQQKQRVAIVVAHELAHQWYILYSVCHIGVVSVYMHYNCVYYFDTCYTIHRRGAPVVHTHTHTCTYNSITYNLITYNIHILHTHTHAHTHTHTHTKVRQPGDDGLVGRALAQRGLRSLHGGMSHNNRRG
jgi:hypothetical protein